VEARSSARALSLELSLSSFRTSSTPQSRELRRDPCSIFRNQVKFSLDSGNHRREFVHLSKKYVHHWSFELIFLLPFAAGTMMAEDLGVEAKEAAVREVAKLLPLPELLQSISSIKADYISRQQVSILFDLIQFIV